MAINYTSLLGLVQPVDGTEAGTWGDDVNNGVSSILDVAVAGTQNITTDGNVTLTITQATSTGTNLTSTSAQYAILLLSGARTATRTVTLPASSKIYTVLNSTTGGFSQTVGGVTIATGEYCQIAYNTSTGTWVKAGTNTITATTATNIAGGAANRIVFQTGSGATSFIAAPTTGSTYLEWNGSSFVWATVSGTGTVTSVSGTGTVNGISLSGTVTSSGSLTLGGTLSGVSLTSQVSGILPVANGGTGSSSGPALSVLNQWSNYNYFGYGSTGYAPPSTPYLATIYSNAADTSGSAITTAAYNGTQYNWTAVVHTTSQYLAYFSQGASGGSLTGIGSITYNGTGTTYGTSSDRRLKDNITALPAGTGLAKIAALQPRSFTWKQNGAADMGFIADELQAVVPNAVSGSPTDVNEDGTIRPQAIDTSFLVVYLIQAVQELSAEIVTLQSKVGA